MIKRSLTLTVLFVALLYPASDPTMAWDVTGNITEHSFIHLSGYMDEMKIYQTDAGYEGQKLVVGTQGSGTVTRRQYAEGSEDELYFMEWGYFDYHPYQVGSSGVVGDSSESDLRNALCAKNYEMGTVISESYTNLSYLLKDTTTYQNDEASIYHISSSLSGMAKIGARVKDGYDGVTVMNYGGTYIGEMTIREEIGVGDVFFLTCP
jgi:hypothetical protein